MSNSSLNPWVYCFANRQIKTGTISLFHIVFHPLRKRVNPDANPWNQGGGGEMSFEMQNTNGVTLLSFTSLTQAETDKI